MQKKQGKIPERAKRIRVRKDNFSHEEKKRVGGVSCHNGAREAQASVNAEQPLP